MAAIWRGWGILAIVLPGCGGLGGWALWMALRQPGPQLLFIGLGVLAGSIGTIALGQYLNEGGGVDGQRDRHTLLRVPMQFLGAVGAAVGVVLAVAGARALIG